MLLAIAALAGCYEHILVNPGIECPVTVNPNTVVMPRARQVDLLFVVDNSNSMAHAQRIFAESFPKLVEAIVTGDSNGDGDPDFPPVESLRAVVVTTDMGVLGVGIDPTEPRFGTCGLRDDGGIDEARALYGDDAVFDSIASGDESLDCDFDGDGNPDTLLPSEMPEFLTFDAFGTVTSAEYGRRFGCFATVGTGGCGFEQQLEAALKSLTPSTSATRFFAASGDDARALGHGDDPDTNAGFLRERSVLGVVMLTDEDDCSALDRAVVDYTDPRYRDPGGGGQFATRCQRYPELLHPVARYVNGFLALRQRASNVVFAAITGVPPELVDDDAAGEGVDNLDAILAAPAMQNVYTARADGLELHGVQNACEVCDDVHGNQNGKCDRGFNDANDDGIDANDCIDSVEVNGVCDLGETPFCSADSNGNGVCDPEDVELAFVDENGNFIRDDEEEPFIEERHAAKPARRITDVARGLRAAGGSVLLRSICDADLTDTIAALAARVSSALRTSCLPATIERVEDVIPCTLVEILPEGLHCDERPSRTFVRFEGRREVCSLEQQSVTEEDRRAGASPSGSGWFYDDYTNGASALCGQARLRVALTDDIDPADADLRLECEDTVVSELFGPDVGDPCEEKSDCAMTGLQRGVFLDRYDIDGARFPDGQPLHCSVLNRTCRIACDTDEQCPGEQVCADPDDADRYGREIWPSLCADTMCSMPEDWPSP